MDENLFKEHIVWGDGMTDTERGCNICYTQTCIKPAHHDRYKVKSDKLATKWDKENPVI